MPVPDLDHDRVQVHDRVDSSNGRVCQALTSSSTASVILEIMSWDSSVPTSGQVCWMSRTVIPPAYSDRIISSSPPARRAPLGTSRGSNVPARSRGVSNGTAPISVARVFGVEPLREFGRPARPDRPLVPQVLGQLGLQASLEHRLDHLREEPARAGQGQLAGVDLAHQIIQQPGVEHLVDRLPGRARPRRVGHTQRVYLLSSHESVILLKFG